MGKKIENLGRLSFAGTFTVLLFAVIILSMFVEIPKENMELIKLVLPELVKQLGLIVAFFFVLQRVTANEKNDTPKP